MIRSFAVLLAMAMAAGATTDAAAQERTRDAPMARAGYFSSAR